MEETTTTMNTETIAETGAEEAALLVNEDAVSQTETQPIESGTEQEMKTDSSNDKTKKQMAELQRQLAQVKKDAEFYKKELRKTKSAEEQRSEDERERQEQIQAELETLRKQAAVASHSKKVFAFVGNEEISNNIAEYLVGAADVDGAIDELNKAWREKEKKLKLEYGKIQKSGPSEEEIKRNKAVEYAKGLGKTKMNNMQSGDKPLSRFII